MKKAFGRQAIEGPSEGEFGDSSVDAARHQVAARLFDSLLHDARNPLNALAINLDVLAERLKASKGGAPALALPQKNVVTMREQIMRVDSILSQFAEFLAARPIGEERSDLSELVNRVARILDYEARRSQVPLHTEAEPGIRMRFAEGAEIRTVLLLASLRGLLRAQQGTRLTLRLARDGVGVAFSVSDGHVGPSEPLPDALRALEILTERQGGSVRCVADECRVSWVEDGFQKEGR